MDNLDEGKIGIQSLIGRCPKTNMKTKCQGRTHSQNQYVLRVQYFMVLVLVWSVNLLLLFVQRLLRGG